MIGEDRPARPERLPVARIRSRGLPGRREPTEEELVRLAASIRRYGVLHPLLVRPSGRDYEVVCGERRYRACRRLGLGEVQAFVRELDDREAFELLVAENARREPLTLEEREEMLRRLRRLFPGRKPEELREWVAPFEVFIGTVELPDWMEEIPETPSREEEVSAGTSSATLRSGETQLGVSAGSMVVRRRSLLGRVRLLLRKLSRSGSLDADLLRGAVSELFRRFERRPAWDFLDLTYRARTRKYVSRHCLNVAKLALFLAHSIGLPREEMETVAVCGLLHDVGMMRIKDEVFTKHAALDQEEWEQVKGHPIEGALLLTKEVVLRDVVARVALEHHERPDGSGYPAGKKKEETHLYARLINVVDTYGAMVSPRAHRLPLLPHQAMKIVMDDGAKGMLDWDLVQAFVRAMSIYPLGSYVRLEGGEIARVVRAQPEIPEKPVIAVIADAQGNILPTPVEIDLAMTEPMPRIEPIASPL